MSQTLTLKGIRQEICHEETHSSFVAKNLILHNKNEEILQA
jgi:hypothetical protein